MNNERVEGERYAFVITFAFKSFSAFPVPVADLT